MKKAIAVLITSLIVVFTNAQVVYDFEKEEARIEKVVEIPNTKKTEAYDRAKIWMASKLKSNDQQIFSNDEKKESLIGTGNLFLPSRFLEEERMLNFKMSIFFKDGRYKYEISELVYSSVSVTLDQQTRTPSKGGLNGAYRRLYTKKKFKKRKFFLQIDEVFKKLTDDLEKAIISEVPSQSDDW